MAPIASADHNDRPPQHPKGMSNDRELEDTIIKCLVQHSAQRTMRGSGLRILRAADFRQRQQPTL